MRPRHLPEAWLFTDPRMGDALWRALERLPRGSGVVFRHYGLPDRAALLARVRVVARRRGLVLVVAGRAGGADGVHLGRWAKRVQCRGIVTAAARTTPELVAAGRAGAALVFLSPVFATRSHPGDAPLGRLRFGLLARGARTPVAALGGMDAERFRSLRPLGASAWGAIDAWT